MRANLEENRISPGQAILLYDLAGRRKIAAEEVRASDSSAFAPLKGPSAAADSNGPSLRATGSDLRKSRQATPQNPESSIFPYIPRKRQERSGLLIDYLYLPAAQEAGDQVDFLILGENRVGVLLADVRGKIPDDCTPILKTVLRSNSTGLSAAATLRYLDQRFKESNANGFSLTAFYAIFDQNKRLLHFASAGHLPMLVYRPSLGKTFLLNTTGSPYGDKDQNGSAVDSLASRNLIESEKVALQQNDLLVLYSDGLLSARTQSGEYFGRQRLVDFISKHGNLDPTSFLVELRMLLEKYSGGFHSNDDITVITLKNVLRNLEQPVTELNGCELHERFLTTDQEHAILEILRDDPRAGVESILTGLAESEHSDLTAEQVKIYLDQNGRWLQPWPARNGWSALASGNKDDNGQDSRAATAAQKSQQELTGAFPLRQLLQKRYRFSGDSAALAAATAHYLQGDYERTLEAFLALRSTIKNSSAGHCFFGNLYLRLNMTARAQREFQDALGVDSKCTHALLGLSYLALLEGDFNFAIEQLASAFRIDPHLTDYQNFLEKLIATTERCENRSEWLL